MNTKLFSKTQAWTFGLLSAGALLLAGCADSSSPDVIKVGEFASLTGKEAAFGQSSHKGTVLAVEDINAAGGVLGRQIRLITDDNQSKAGESTTIVKKLITLDKVVAVLGEVASGRSKEGAPVCQERKIPMISPASTNPEVTQVGDYIFRVCFIDPFQGSVIGKFTLDTLKARRVAVLTDVAAPYSVGLSEFFKEYIKTHGGTVVADQKFTGGDKDFKGQLTAIKAVNPEAIFAPVYYTEAGLIALQARELGIAVPLLGGDGWEASQLIEIGGKALEGCYFSTHYSAESQAPEVVEFVRKYKARYNNEIPDTMAGLGYDSMMVLADAIRRAGTTDPQPLRDAIAATRDFPGVTGRLTLDANRNASKSAVVMTIKDGQFKYVETIAP